MRVREEDARLTSERAPLFGRVGAHGVDKIEKHGWTMLDQIGVLQYLPKGELRIDHSYQRSVSDARARTLAAAWSWLACNTLVVAEREPGVFFVVDGQTRLDAAKRRSDISEMPCSVFKSSGVAEEAAAFVRLNCHRGHVLVFDRLRADVAADNPLAMGAMELMQKCGYHASKGDEHWGLRALGCFLRYFATERDLLEQVFPVLARVHKGVPIRDDILQAFMYVAKYGEVDFTRADWVRRVESVGLDKLRYEIDRAKALYQAGGAKVYARGAVEALNKGLRMKQRIRLNVD